MTNQSNHDQVVILGGGPAGLTAAYELTGQGLPAAVLERDRHYVGGIARTVQHNGYRFDIGGHRFFSKNQEIEDLWTEILGDEMLTRGRLSRIYYRGRYFDYPLKATNALMNLGPLETLLCMTSYARAKVAPVRDPRSLEDWVRNQFGWRLYSMFFKTYTEKVWGMSTKELSADWAAQRIKGLNLGQVIKTALIPQRSSGDRGAVIKTLIDRFRYPRFGPGQLWERVRDVLAERGQPVMMGYSVRGLRHRGARAISAMVEDPAGNMVEVPGHQFISSLPIRNLILGLEPEAPEQVRQAASSLGYRDFLTVALMIRREQVFPDNWIYIHDPTVKVGRIQNFKNWSPSMVPDAATTCLGLEYFCFEGDGLWSAPDADLIELAAGELEKLGMCSRSEVFDGCVVRQAKAYPVYDDHYLTNVALIREYLSAAVPNLHLVGRNGMHKYNNQDHSMLTALIAARNIAGTSTLDPWRVNADAEYHEEVRAGEADTSGRRMPAKLAS